MYRGSLNPLSDGTTSSYPHTSHSINSKVLIYLTTHQDQSSSHPPRTNTPLTPLTQVTLMLRPLLPNKNRLLHLDPRPPLQPIRHPLDIRLLINSNAPQPLTRLASLVVHHGVVPVSGAIPQNANGDLLAAPASLFAGGVGAEEGGHYVCFVFVGVVGGVGSGDVFEIGG